MSELLIADAVAVVGSFAVAVAVAAAVYWLAVAIDRFAVDWFAGVCCCVCFCWWC